MIVTQLSSGTEDSEVCLEGEVIEPENEGGPSTLDKSLEYYLKEDDIDEFQTNITENVDTNRFNRVDSDSDMDFNLGESEESGEFSLESLGRRFKTLVDIVTEPIKVECPTSSSGSPEDSDAEETFAIIPSFKRLSTDFINETSKFFKTAGSNTTAADSENISQAPLDSTAEGIGNNWNVDIISKWF
ncbi:conserved hypothetical protein [Theileria orientalis strain Shintoku]|uniref:Uncharacterized protein n=1 Tax=Theileria orientalis strain Shintoku TaxID=869250 RepID=J7MC64_THEOR|nr:conserved hypothetical protein [Theileria orientalis strain Shintoku]BAM42312.1 conserved hypothetical protein [Theileria orientalis strain Shintoku]|eukprot:XP_009692613.1 conserved hypothetical protein [Theileria orientalis strain Shintoku]